MDQLFLGADFLRAFNLLGDIGGEQILDASSLQVISSLTSPTANQMHFFTALVNTQDLPEINGSVWSWDGFCVYISG